jgi:hypothetical protein
LESRRAEQVLSWGVGTGGRGEEVRDGCGKVNICKYCVHKYVNGKMVPVETIPQMRGVAIKENDGGGEFRYDIFDTL